MKNSQKGFKGICEQAEKRSSELEDGRMKIIKSEKPKEKEIEEKEAETKGPVGHNQADPHRYHTLTKSQK